MISDEPLTVTRDVRISANHRHDSRATHTSAVLVFLQAGSAVLEIGGRIKVSAGDLVLIPHGVPHRSLEVHGARGWGLSLCPTCWKATGNPADLGSIERIRDGAIAIASVPASRHGWIESLFDELERVVKESARAQHLAALLLAEFEQHADWSAERKSTVTQDALRYLEANCLRALTVAEVARSVGRSPSHLTTLVRRETGLSLQKWMTNFRIAEAKRRLLHSDEAIDVIGNRVGYADATHFIRVFRRETGITPSAWRKSPLSRRGEGRGEGK